MDLPEFNAGIHSTDADKKGFLNLGLGESPYGMSPHAHERFVKAVTRHIPYPDTTGALLAEKIGAFHGCTTESVFLGNGIDEIILALALVFLKPGEKCLINCSTFSGFESAALAVRGELLYAPIVEKGLNVAALAELLRLSPRLWFLCNPHNPTGTILKPGDLEYLLDIAKENGVIAVVDEAYAEYADPNVFQSAAPHIKRYPHLIVMRTFSKIYGLAGLRCGYAIGNQDLIRHLWKVKHVLPFSVNRFALATAAAALEDQAFVQDCYRKTEEVKQFFQTALNKLGLDYSPSQTNFILVRFDKDVEPICEELKEKHRILIRSAKPFGFPHHGRITLGTLHQMQRLADALSNIKEASHGPFRIAF